MPIGIFGLTSEVTTGNRRPWTASWMSGLRIPAQSKPSVRGVPPLGVRGPFLRPPGSLDADAGRPERATNESPPVTRGNRRGPRDGSGPRGRGWRRGRLLGPPPADLQRAGRDDGVGPGWVVTVP